jgi:hypothetical protein
MSRLLHFLNGAKSSCTSLARFHVEVNLVDLAGSERADSTGNTGVRLKEVIRCSPFFTYNNVRPTT